MGCFFFVLIIEFNHASWLNEIGAVQSVSIRQKNQTDAETRGLPKNERGLFRGLGVLSFQDDKLI